MNREYLWEISRRMTDASSEITGLILKQSSIETSWDMANNRDKIKNQMSYMFACLTELSVLLQPKE